MAFLLAGETAGENADPNDGWGGEIRRLFVHNCAETDKVDSRKADVQLVEGLTDLGANILPFVPYLIIVDLIEALHVRVILWSCCWEVGICRRAINQRRRPNGCPCIVEPGLVIGDTMRRCVWGADAGERF